MREFHSLFRHGFARVAACTLPASLADPHSAATGIAEVVRTCSDQGAVIAVFPELCLSGYAIDDLRQQDVLLDAVRDALIRLAAETADCLPLFFVGAPLCHGDALYNCAVAIHRGRIIGVVPKSFLPGYREFYENRQFTAGAGLTGEVLRIGDHQDIPFGTDILFEASDIPGLVIGTEICEDIWVPDPPSTRLALSGATVIANLSASNITVGKAEERDLLCRSHSARCHLTYLYAAAGEGESTTDVAWDGQVSIFENGKCLAATDRFPSGPRIAFADTDLDLLRQERLRMTSFAATADAYGLPPVRRISLTFDPPVLSDLRRAIPRFPFVPEDPGRLALDCYEACTIQVSALKQRLKASRSRTLVIGVSGGLDSTHALLVAVRAAEELGLGREAVLGFTMPGFGTSDTTKSLAHELMRSLGVTAAELDIRPTALRMLEEMGHPYAKGEPVYDITFENVQAGLRTDFLFRIANQKNGIVIGTGDLSELALGWCTYGVGDQMAHYNVNSGLPKTLIQHLIRWFISSGRFSDTTARVLREILSCEISPELIPAGPDGVQSTEATIGPYALHDFFLFYVLRYGFRPSRIAWLAEHAWGKITEEGWPPEFPEKDRRSWTLAEIRHWLKIFLQRYFTTSQFKRSAMPNGPKIVAGGALSPRGDWRAPSDGNARIWLDELESNVPTGED
ncbi:NAD(+) synthase [Acetobacter sp. AN02]|uniref:NAD(+) synthase n=1 Tax=Acetobacter sp. AN02 TaxID=2894186 RepID=UPI002434580F|nr:NAD(+) synthase [Acetobacter sp. AN02]MDG6093538.1 NAD(+) synthase [Acetobacter sp. AN02]